MGAQTSIRDHPARRRWNARFAERGFEAFPDRPADWLLENEDLVSQKAPGRALDLACGNGRNAAYLARRGFAVDAVDISDYAIERLGRAVRRTGIAVTPMWMDLEADALPGSGYDVVVNFNYLERSLFDAIEAALAPGGLLVFETFSPQARERLRTSLNPRYVLDSKELLRAFSDLTVLRYREGPSLEHGPESERGVASLVARK